MHGARGCERGLQQDADTTAAVQKRRLCNGNRKRAFFTPSALPTGGNRGAPPKRPLRRISANLRETIKDSVPGFSLTQADNFLCKKRTDRYKPAFCRALQVPTATFVESQHPRPAPRSISLTLPAYRKRTVINRLDLPFLAADGLSLKRQNGVWRTSCRRRGAGARTGRWDVIRALTASSQ